MKLRCLTAVAVAAAMLHVPAQAQRGPSAHLRCDGNPDNMGDGERAARVIGAITLVGLFAPSPEAPDVSQRRSGIEGIAACNEVIAREANAMRRAQLILARAIHEIEAGRHEAAIATARSADTDRPEFAASAPYRLSLHLSATEIEATALLTMGRTDEAIAKALQMADAAPYDVVNQLRALRFVRLAGRYGPAERPLYDWLVRLYPSALLERAHARQMGGDFRGAAEDYELWMALERSLFGKAGMATLAHAALLRGLAGDAAPAADLAGQARDALSAEPNGNAAAAAGEILDLYQIWEKANAGSVADARLLFANRATWLRPSPAAVGEVARLLRAGATPEQLTGTLARDPAAYRSELLQRRTTELTQAKNHFAAIRPFQGPAMFQRFSANVWRSGRSRYLAREPNEGLNARLINVQRDGFGASAGYALLLHAALSAQAEGRSRFMLLPAQTSPALGFVRTGNAGDEALLEPMSFETVRVIADLSPLFPRPTRSR